MSPSTDDDERDWIDLLMVAVGALIVLPVSGAIGAALTFACIAYL